MSALDLIASKLGDRYRIERELGRGGMGAVFLARDVRLDRPVALKVLPSEFANQVALRDRFLRETRTAASFSHPNIVPVYSVEETDDQLAYAMAYVEGESLAERVRRAGPLGVRDAVRLLQDVAYALAYAHGRGVVHRDIKPDNIMIERATGRALVMDFGIARLITGPVAPGTEGLTRVGEVVGTPEYMSPEQATGDHVDGRSDLYSLALTLFFGLTGTPAISGDTTGRILARQITEAMPSVRERRPDLPPALAEAIDKCAAKDPADRFANAEALVEALDAAQLAVPEIPLQVRLLAQEGLTLSTLMIIGAVIFVWMGSLLVQNFDNLDALLPIVLFGSVLVTRLLQMLREAGRLSFAGFGDEEIRRGMAAVVDERETRRAELRQHEPTRRARRRTIFWSVVQVVGAAAMMTAAWSRRVEYAPNQYRTGLGGIVLVLSSMILFGIGVSLLARSPFRMPMAERVFRLIWLGAIGARLLRFARRKNVRVEGSTTRPGVASVSRVESRTPPVSIPRGAGPQLAALESRVAELEKWRREKQTSS